jgi:hypothetical protein
MSVIRTFTVTVANPGSGNRYYIDDVLQDTINLAEGYTYVFNYPSAHPFRFSTTSDGTHNSGSEYTTGVTVNSSTQVQITVAASAPTLYYYCSIHSGMGGQANTVDSDTWGMLQWNQNAWGSQDIIEVSLSGLSATTTLGELLYAAADDGYGRDAWGDNSWGNNQTPVTLTGLTATTTIGTFPYAQASDGWGRDAWGDNDWGENEITVSLAGLGLTATASLPSVGWGNQVFGSDNEGWGGIYQLPVANVIGLTGLSAQTTLGTATAKSDFSTELTGLSLQSSPGLLSVDDHSVGLTGLEAETTLGSITPADVMGLTGVSAQTAIGSLSITSNPVTDVTGVSATSSVGSLTISNITGVTLSALSSTSAVGSLTTTQLSIASLVGLGQTATTTLNDAGIILRYYGRLSPKTSTGYSRKTPKDSTGYTRKVAN